MATSKKGKITELYDLDAIQKQQETVISLVGTLVDTINKVKPITITPQGGDKTKDIIDGANKLSQATQQVADVSGKAVNAMGQLVDMAAKTTKANAAVAGSYEQLIRLSTQNKIASQELAAARKQLDKAYQDGAVTIEHYVQQLDGIKAKELEISVANQDVNRALKNMEKGFQSAGGSLNALRSELNLALQAFDRMSQEEKASDFGKEATKNIADLTAKISEQEQATGRFSRNVGNYSGALGTLEKAMTDVKGKIDQMNQSGNVNESVMQQLQKEYAALSNVVENQAAGFISMRQEIKANEVAIEQLIQIYGEDSAVVKKLILENANLRDSFSDLQAQQKTLGSDTFAFDALLQGGQALVGMYSAAQGAAALFGDQSEDLQKTMVKLQAAMALVQGVQAVVNALQKESALVQGILAVRTTLVSAAMRVYTFVTGGATAAAKAFNTALVAGGIGIALLLISQVASAMGTFGDSTEESTASLEDFNKELEFTGQLLDDMKEGLDFDTKVAVEKLKQVGASQSEITKREQEGLQKKIDSNNKAIQSAREAQAAILSSDKDADKKRQKLRDDEDKLIRENSHLQNDIYLKGEQDKTKIAEDERNKRKQQGEKATQESKQRAEAEFKAAFELQKYYAQKEVDELNKKSSIEGAPLTTRLTSLTDALAKEEKMITAQRDFELKGQNVTESQRALIIKKSEDNIQQIREQYADKAIGIRQSEIASLQEDAKAAQEVLANEVISTEQKRLETSLKINQDTLNKEIDQELARYSAGEITKEQYEENKLAIENKFRKESLLAEITYYENLIQFANLPADKEKEALKALQDLRQQVHDADVKGTEEANAKKMASDKKYHEQLAARLKELGDEIKDTIFVLLNAGVERQKNQIQERIDALEEQKKKEIEVVDQTVLSQQDKAAKIAVIEAKAANQRETLDRRKRQLDEQKARFDRAKAVVDVIENTATAVIKTLAEYPGPHGIVLAAIIGAIGAAQLIKILATPIPKYAEGEDDHGGGLAIVGDGGKKEYVQTPDGNIYETPDESTLVDMPKHSKVYKDKTALMDAMASYHLNASLRIGDRKPNDYYQFQNMTKELGGKLEKVEKAVKNIPQPVFDRGGLKQIIHGNGSVIEYLKGL
jgi:hypothetical protein